MRILTNNPIISLLAVYTSEMTWDELANSAKTGCSFGNSADLQITCSPFLTT